MPTSDFRRLIEKEQRRKHIGTRRVNVKLSDFLAQARKEPIPPVRYLAGSRDAALINLQSADACNGLQWRIEQHPQSEADIWAGFTRTTASVASRIPWPEMTPDRAPLAYRFYMTFAALCRRDNIPLCCADYHGQAVKVFHYFWGDDLQPVEKDVLMIKAYKAASMIDAEFMERDLWFEVHEIGAKYGV